MGHIRKEDNGTWRVVYDSYDKDGKRKQTSKRGFRLQGNAKAFLAKVEAAKIDGTFVVSSSTLLVDYKNDWLKREYKEKVASEDKKPKTYEYYKAMLSTRFDDYFSGVRLQRVTPQHIEDYLKYLRTAKGRNGKPLSKNTIRKHYKILSVLFGYAYKHRDIMSNPMALTEAPKSEKVSVSFWPPDIIPDAVKLFVGTEIEWHVRLALLTGMRRGEICGLHEDFIDFNNGEFTIRQQCQKIDRELLFIPPKTEVSAEPLPITENIKQLLSQRIRENKKNRLLFGSKYDTRYIGRLSVRADGSFIAPDYVYRAFTGILRSQTKIPVIRFHDLRHTCAVWHIANKTDMKTLQKILRHTSYRTTADIYADTTMDIKREAMSKMSF
jgi:integrase